MSSIVVLGDVNVDILSLISGEINYASDTSAINRLAVGGSPCNMAAWAAHSKAQVTLIADVGNDFLGQWLIDQLHTGSIATELISRTPERTGTCVIIVDDKGQRTMFPDFGANLDMTLDDIRTNAIRDARYLVMSAYTFLRPETQSLALQALEIAKAANTRVVVDAASSAPIRACGAVTVRTYLEQADIVLANDDEIEALIEDGFSNWLQTLPNVIIKHGSEGASWLSRGRLRVELPANDISVVDTTGAGDALCGGLVAALVALPELEALTSEQQQGALQSAIDIASVCCQHIGAWPTSGS